MPKNIYLYHSKDDEFVKPNQPIAFRDVLQVEAYNVSLYLIEKTKHHIPTNTHINILNKILLKVAEDRTKVK